MVDFQDKGKKTFKSCLFDEKMQREKDEQDLLGNRGEKQRYKINFILGIN